MMEADPEDRTDPMARIFPRVTKCTFNKFGPSGSLMRRDALCVLPVNIVNEVEFHETNLAKRESFACRKSMFFYGSGLSSSWQ